MAMVMCWRQEPYLAWVKLNSENKSSNQQRVETMATLWGRNTLIKISVIWWRLSKSKSGSLMTWSKRGINCLMVLMNGCWRTVSMLSLRDILDSSTTLSRYWNRSINLLAIQFCSVLLTQKDTSSIFRISWKMLWEFSSCSRTIKMWSLPTRLWSDTLSLVHQDKVSKLVSVSTIKSP